MRPAFSTTSLLLLFFLFFFFLDSLGVVATSTPPSMAPSPPPSDNFHPADTVEEACHLMGEFELMDEYKKGWLVWYPDCVAAFRSNPKSRNATIHELAVLAAEILQQDALVELERMKEMKSRGIGDPQALLDCSSGFDMFTTVLPGSMGDLRKDGRVGFQYFFNQIWDWVDCRETGIDLKKQAEILGLIHTLFSICDKYCRYPAPKPCRYW